jgi:hypothetical protein
MKINLRFYLIVLNLIIFIFRFSSYAQISVAPVTIHLSENEKTGFFVVENNFDEKKEIEIDLNFGYPVSDDSGNVFVEFFDLDSTNTKSAVKWIRIYPRIFVLDAKEYQTVRLVVRPPSDLQKGEYWARPSIVSRTVVQLGKTENIEKQVQIKMEMKIFISLNYRNGEVETGIEIKSLKARKEKNKMYILTDLSRKGNSAFLGNMVTRIKDKNGKVKKEKAQDIAVYYNLLKKVELDITDINLEQCVLEVELNTDREEQSEKILKSKTESRTIGIP